MDPLAELVGDSPAIASLREEVRRLLRRQSGGSRQPPVLLQGETGTGKGLLAHVLHRASPRARGPFIDINCAAIPDTLLEAELFGYERGAFTDARAAKPGLFQSAHGGTLFLDEVGLLAPALQRKLLQALEAGVVRRLGATRSEPAHVWVVAATNEDLADAVRAGRFRQDLYHRLAVLTLVLPPLRTRGHDVSILAARFLRHFCDAYGLPGKSLGESARAALLGYHWPGNVRELANVLERAVLLSDAPMITADMLGLSRPPARGPGVAGDAPPPEDAARRELVDALTRTSWNVSHTAVRLGISRNTVRARIRRFGLTRAEAVAEAGPASPAEPAPPAARRPARPAAAEPAAPPPAPVALRWERRRVALLHLGLGSGGDEDFAPLRSSRWLQVMIDKARSFGGQVEGISPLGIDAVFGIERTEDPARRAAHAALAVRQLLTAGRSRGAAPAPAIRAAIHAGQVLVVYAGGPGRIDEESRRRMAPVMDAILTAAAPGSIVVSGTTATFLRRRFSLQELDQAAPGLTLFQLSGHEQLAAGKAAPFVGRDQELALLNTRLGVARAGEGQLVTVVGDPGVGKSRLVWELVRSLGTGPVRLLETGATHASATPYQPLVELLRRYFDIAPDDAPAKIRHRVAASLGGGDERLQPLLPALLALLGVVDRDWETLDPAERRHRTRQAVTRLLTSASRARPLLIVFEDAHWIDPESQAVLDALVEALPSASLMLLVTCRPEYQPRWGALPSHIQLPIGPLPPEAARELLDSLAGADPSLQPVKRRLIEWTDGNPFFLEESVQALVETGILEGERGGYRATRPVQTVEVAATVEDVLAERIDRLPVEGKAVIRGAAAVGAEVPLGLLSSVLDLPQDALQRGLEQLQESRLLYENGAAREREVVFRHALTQEVAYRSLLPEARRDLHQRIVTATEAATDSTPEQLDRLARHAFQGELWGKASAYLRHAGDKALRSAALRRARECYEQALEALAHQAESREVLEDRIDLRLRLRDVLWPQARMTSILLHLQAAQRLAAVLEDRRRQGWIDCYLSQYFWGVGDPDRALAASDRALAIAASLDDTALLAETSVYRGVVHYSRGAFREATAILAGILPTLDHAVAHAASAFPSRRFAQTGPVILLSFLARALAELGDFPEALAHGNEAVRRAGVGHSAFAAAAANGGLGAVYLRQGHAERAIRVLEPALEVCRTYELNHWIATVGGTLGAAHVRVGRVAAGVALLEECVAHGDRRGLGASNSLWLIYLGEAYLRAGRPEDALALAHRALARCHERQERGYEAWAIRLLGEVAAEGETPDLHEAAARYQEALVLGQACGMRPLVASCHAGLDTLHARARNRAIAGTH